jgi:hypothetical protein
MAVIKALVVAAALAHGVSSTAMLTVAERESTFDRYATNGLGCVGLYQLCPRGELGGFYARGYADPWDPSEQANFAAERFREGACPQAWAATCPRWALLDLPGGQL